MKHHLEPQLVGSDANANSLSLSLSLSHIEAVFYETGGGCLYWLYYIKKEPKDIKCYKKQLRETKKDKKKI